MDLTKIYLSNVSQKVHSQFWPRLDQDFLIKVVSVPWMFLCSTKYRQKVSVFGMFLVFHQICPPCVPWCTMQVGGVQHRSMVHNIVLYSLGGAQCRSHKPRNPSPQTHSQTKTLDSCNWHQTTNPNITSDLRLDRWTDTNSTGHCARQKCMQSHFQTFIHRTLRSGNTDCYGFADLAPPVSWFRAAT